MAEKGKKRAGPLFTVSLYPPMALFGYLVLFTASLLVYGTATGIADVTYTYLFLGLLILLLYVLYYILSQRVWRARFYEKMFAIDGRKRHGDVSYGQIKQVSAVRTLFGLVSAVEVTLKNEPARFRILGNPRNEELQSDLHGWLLEQTAGNSRPTP